MRKGEVLSTNEARVRAEASGEYPRVKGIRVTNSLNGGVRYDACFAAGVANDNKVGEHDERNRAKENGERCIQKGQRNVQNVWVRGMSKQESTKREKSDEKCMDTHKQTRAYPISEHAWWLTSSIVPSIDNTYRYAGNCSRHSAPRPAGRACAWVRG